MKKQFATFEVSSKLKELGFNEPCFGVFDGKMKWYEVAFDGKTNTIRNSYYANLKTHNPGHIELGVICTAPTWQQVADWLRENYGYFIFEDHRMNGDVPTYWFGVKKLTKSVSGVKVVLGLIDTGCFTDYYKGRESVILKAIGLIV